MTKVEYTDLLIATISLMAACVLVYVSLNHLPFRYYQYIRIGVTAALGSSAYFFYQRGNLPLVAVSILFALVFMLYKGHRSNWVVIDIISAAVLLIPTLIIAYVYFNKSKTLDSQV